jgi:ferredoxin-NADP reductase
MAMIRHRERVRSDAPTRLLYSSRTIDEVIYRDELEQLRGDGLEVVHTLTREQPAGWTGYARRIDADLVREVAFAPDERPHTFICGSTPFVEAAASLLVGMGYEPLTIKTERYGAAGG